ncbi:MAG: hypothetical protein IJ736_09445 [Firmicutes bacterium]|nr:hypothetical protein [Bacillota bacterium]
MLYLITGTISVIKCADCVPRSGYILCTQSCAYPVGIYTKRHLLMTFSIYPIFKETPINACLCLTRETRKE